MKTFQEYVNLKEIIAAYDVGTDIMGRGQYSKGGQDVFSQVLKAFASLLGKNPEMMINWLIIKAHSDPQAMEILSGIDPSDPSLRRDMTNAAKRSRRAIARGLGDSDGNDGDDDNDDVIVPPAADSNFSPNNL